MTARAITLAVMAMGGEGGGVLADWLVDLGEHEGWTAQTTSVPGVAQRTGATIYYIELFPPAPPGDVRRPVLALMPVPGEVDVVLASELMESGRAIQRGLVTADRTTLIASTHRVYAIGEKTAMGDGRVDAAALAAAGAASAREFLSADFARIADEHGSVISAALFGALAASGCLPFGRDAFEQAIRRAGVGVNTSLATFAGGFDAALAARACAASIPMPMTGAGEGTSSTAPPASPVPPVGPRLAALAARVQAEFPADARATLVHGLLRLADYQDVAYAGEYLDALAPLARRRGPQHAALVESAARALAVWMSYEDIARVADLKTRAARFARVGREVRLADGQLLAIDEFLHPRVEEIADALPASAGRWLLGSRVARPLVERFTRDGKVVRTSSLRGFLLMYSLAGLRRWRRGSLRFRHEQGQWRKWLASIAHHADRDPAFAQAVAGCQRLLKGYGDTYLRGRRSFTRLMDELPALAGRADGAARLRALTDAALSDENGAALERMLNA